MKEFRFRRLTPEQNAEFGRQMMEAFEKGPPDIIISPKKVDSDKEDREDG